MYANPPGGPPAGYKKIDPKIVRPMIQKSNHHDQRCVPSSYKQIAALTVNGDEVEVRLLGDERWLHRLDARPHLHQHFLNHIANYRM